MAFDFETFPSLTTDRLRLRQIQEADISFIHKGLSDPSVIQHYGVSYKTLEATKEQMQWYNNLWSKRLGVWWLITNRENNTLLGACGFNDYQVQHRKAEIGYWLLPAYWGKGYASEAIHAMIEFSFATVKLHRLEAYVETDNAGSLSLLERLDFLQEAHLRECEWKNGKFIDLFIFAKLCHG